MWGSPTPHGRCLRAQRHSQATTLPKPSRLGKWNCCRMVNARTSLRDRIVDMHRLGAQRYALYDEGNQQLSSSVSAVRDSTSLGNPTFNQILLPTRDCWTSEYIACRGEIEVRK